MKLSLFVTFFAALLLASPALAQPPEGPREGSRPQVEREVRRERPQGRVGARQRTERARLDLGLTDSQKADLREAREGARREKLRTSTDMKIASLDLKSLLRAEKVDEKAVAAKLAEVQAAQGALLKLRVDSALAMKRILTPEQQKMLTEHRGGRPGMKQRNRGMRSPGNRGKGRSRDGRSYGSGGPFDDAGVDLDPDADQDPLRP